MKFKIKYNRKFMAKNSGMTLWPWVLFQEKKEDVSDRLFRHELEHCYQIKREGRLKFYASYFWQLITKGYRNISYEVEAYAIWETPLTEQEKKWRESGVIEL